MDSKVVNRAIKSNVWAMLKEHGFDYFSSRTAWRFQNDRIDVVNFQSFNSYNASIIGCTTYSFAINLGCYFLYVPYQYGTNLIKQKNGRLIPDESACFMRGRLHPREHQRLFDRLMQKHKPSGIWRVDENGANLDRLINEAKIKLERKGIEWFSRFERPENLLEILTSEAEDMEELWGFGNNPCPLRSYLTGYVALRCGQTELAVEQLQKAEASGCFSLVSDRLLNDIRQAAQHVTRTDGFQPPLS